MSPGPHGQSTDITVRNGVAMPAEVGVEALLRTPSLGSADQWIEATLHVGSSRVDNYTGIMVRVSDTGGRYAWHKFEVWAGSTTQFRLLTLVDNRIAEEHYFDYTIRPNSDYRLRLEARGTTLTGYVDGVRLFSVDVFLNTTATSTGLHFMTGGRLDDATLDDVETGVL